ncbi:endogenous retrovirus group K member 18 Pro protein-like [Acridotheres tristis]
MRTKIMGPNKPILECSLFCHGEKIQKPGMIDTGADVTVIARSEWPPHWEVQPVAGMLSGIVGVAISMRSRCNVVIEGPEGKLAAIRPFVVRAPITLWGRDALTQWGASLRVQSQDF